MVRTRRRLSSPSPQPLNARSNFWFSFPRRCVRTVDACCCAARSKPVALCCCTGKEMTRLSTWWAASPSCPKVKRTCCCGTERTTSASCTRLARIVRSCGSGRLPSSITVPVGLFFLSQHQLQHLTECHEFSLVLILLTSFFFYFFFYYPIFGFRLSTKLQGRSLGKSKTSHFVLRVEDEQVNVFRLSLCSLCRQDGTQRV